MVILLAQIGHLKIGAQHSSMRSQLYKILTHYNVDFLWKHENMVNCHCLNMIPSQDGDTQTHRHR